MAISDIYQQLSRYRGYLGWNTYTDGSGATRPALEVELYIKDHPIPMRKPKVTEIATLSNLDPIGKFDTNAQALFYGAPDPLQMQLQGWIITPRTNGVWKPVDKNGFNLPYGNRSYADIVSLYLAGWLNLSSGGAYQRKDPDYYISPYGQQYNNPTITSWQAQVAVGMKRQTFTMTLQLEE